MDPVSSLSFQCPFNPRPWYETNSKLINYIISFYVNVIVLPFRADFKLFEAFRERDRSPCPFANRFVNVFEFQHEFFRRDSIRRWFRVKALGH